MANDYDDAEASASGGEAMPGEADPMFRKLTGWYRTDVVPVRTWRKAAKEEWAFYANKQWNDTELTQLNDQGRPGLVFNRIGPMVNAIVGAEINNRREVRYFPREQGDAKANEVLSAAAEWFRDECGAEDEESDGWKATVICGMGWMDTRLDFDEEPDGAPKIEQIDEFEMVWDRNSVKANLSDATRLFRVREMTYAEAAQLTGEKDRKKLHAAWAVPEGTTDPHDQDEADKYSGTQSPNNDGLPAKCTLVEARWIERQAYHRAPDLETGEIREYSEEQLAGAQKLFMERFPGQEFPSVRQMKKITKRAFLGSELLGKIDKPMVPEGMFGWECITGYRDKVEKQWYGFVRAALDPQRWSNKFFSQVQYLLNSQSKGGIIAERGAFENDRQAEQSLAKADQITWAQAGSLSGERPKIIPKNPAQFPAGFFTLFQETKEAINDVTGLSAEFLGTREVDQAGVLEYQRKQSSLNLLAELFNSLRRYRKRQGREMLYLIQKHLSDGRLIRVVGDGLKQYVPLTKEDVADKHYDIIVDDSPTSPNEKERTWQIIMQMLPIVKDLITPEIALELMDASPLPPSFVEGLKKKAAEQAQQPKPPTPEEQAIQAKAQAEEQKAQIDIAGKQADLQAQQQSNEMDVQMKGIDLMMKQQDAQLDAEIAEQKAQIDMANLAIKAEANRIAAKNAASKRTSSAKQ